MVVLTAIGATLGVLWALHPGTPPALPPCPTEDSVGCYWDAPTMGNGDGRSYTVDDDGTTHYVPECPPVHAYNSDGVEVPVLGHWC